MERNVESLKDELEDLDKCVDRETMLDLIYEIVLSPNIKKCKGSSYSSESSEDFDKWVEEEDDQVTVRCH